MGDVVKLGRKVADTVRPIWFYEWRGRIDGFWIGAVVGFATAVLLIKYLPPPPT